MCSHERRADPIGQVKTFFLQPSPLATRIDLWDGVSPRCTKSPQLVINEHQDLKSWWFGFLVWGNFEGTDLFEKVFYMYIGIKYFDLIEKKQKKTAPLKKP